MKILIATGLYPPETGGPATYSKLLEERLPALGFAPHVLPFSAVRHLPPGVRHAAYFWKCFLMARKADIMYAQDTVSVGLPAALASVLAGKKFLVRVPGDYAWEQGRQRFGVRDELDEFQTKKYGWRVELLRIVQKFVVRRAASAVVPSNYMKTIVDQWTDPKKVQVIYSSIALPVPFQLPHNRPGSFLIVTAARLVPWKGVDGLIRVIAKEKKWHLVIIDDGPERKNLEALAQKLGVDNRVQFVGRLPRAQALGWIKAADVFALNSTYEGLSYLLIEAMALGTPVVATNIGGNPEVVESDVDGLLILPKADEALHAALQNMEAHHALARERAMAGIKKIEQNFSADRAIEKLIRLFQNL